jgi:hypothetical protein
MDDSDTDTDTPPGEPRETSSITKKTGYSTGTFFVFHDDRINCFPNFVPGGGFCLLWFVVHLKKCQLDVIFTAAISVCIIAIMGGIM